MTTRSRLVSLDVLRGATVAAMIVVNNPGNWLAVPAPLQHASWNGWTLADLVFPFFIVIMGVAMPLVLRPAPAAQAFRRVLVRTATLCAIGIALNLATVWPDVAAIRLPGVLQRLSLTYAFTAILLLTVSSTVQAWSAVALLLVHWAVLMLVPFGGMPAGIVTPEHNLAAWIDTAVFGAHLLTPTGDPEGLLGVLPSVATALVGVQVGRRLMRQSGGARLPPRLLAWGTICVCVGLAWSVVWPLNKTLWSGSFALFAAGTAIIAFALCDVLMRTSAIRRLATPFEWLGVNALAIYIGSEFVGHLLDRPLLAQAHGWASGKDIVFWRWIVPIVGDVGGPTSSLIYAVGYTVLWVAVAGMLFRYDARLRV